MKTTLCRGRFAVALVTAAGLGAAATFGQAAKSITARPANARELRVEHRGGEYGLIADSGELLRVSQAPIANQRIASVPQSDVLIATWDEDAGGELHHRYAVSRDGRTFDPSRPTSYRLALRHGAFEPSVDSVPVAASLAATEACHLYIVQYVAPPMDEFRSAIRALGGVIYKYFPHNAEIVRMDAATRTQVAALPFVRAIEPYHPAYRLEKALARALVDQGSTLETQRYRIEVFKEGPQQLNAVADRVSALGGTIDRMGSRGILLEATLTPAQLRAIAEMDEVLFIDRWTPPQTFMNNVRIVGGADYLESVAGFTGAGVRGEIMDDGCQIDHPDFTGRIAVRGSTAPLESHGTATFGIVFGSGAGSAHARGMMPDAFGYYHSWQYAGSRYDDTAALVTAPYNCVFQSNSWSYGYQTAYTTVSAEMDKIVYDFDIVILNAQGNSGTQGSAEHAWGKNIVGVGGIRHHDDADVLNDEWSGAGSIGPAFDGRIKPDLCYYYDFIHTTAPVDGYTDYFGGTSAATPETAGHFGLFFQMWAAGVFGNPVSGGTVFEERPHSATARAAMINSARPYDFSGPDDDLTRVHQGWGRANVQDLYDRRDRMLFVDEVQVLQQGDRVQYGRTVDTDDDIFRATLVYTDVEGTTSSTQNRINDLTLKVTSPSLEVYYGNNGLLDGNISTLGGSPDTIDPVENVWIENPEPGNWTVEVVAAEIVADGHPETPATTDADFALVVTGGTECTATAPTFTAQPSNQYTCLGDDVVISAGVTGYQSLQWFRDGSPLPGETAASLLITDFGPEDSGEYRLAAVGSCVTVWSNPVQIFDAGSPVITQQPQSPAARCAGSDAYLTVKAGGTGPFTYQWYHDGEPIAGATSATFALLPALAEDAGDYSCRVTNQCAAIDSNTVTMVINPLPEFTEQPQDACGMTGDSFELTVDATPGSGVFYQWRKVGVSSSLGTGQSLSLTNVQPSAAGEYYAIAFTLNPTCVSESEHAMLTVLPSLGDDCDSNGIPDECGFCGDLDGDQDVDLDDRALMVGSMPYCEGSDAYLPLADMDGDGCVTLLDYQSWLVCADAFAPCAQPASPTAGGTLEKPVQAPAGTVSDQARPGANRYIVDQAP